MTELIESLAFADYQARPGVHKSMLDEFARSPQCGYEYMILKHDTPTHAQIIGSAVDCMLCEPDQFVTRFWARPETYESPEGEKPWNGNSKICRQWLAAHQSKPILTNADALTVRAMVAAIANDKKAMRLIEGCSVQTSLFWSDDRTGLQLKGRPDFVRHGYAIDLKSCRDASERGLSHAVAEYRYYVQAAMYMDGLSANGRVCDKFYFLGVEPGVFPKTNIRQLDPKAIDLGRMVYNEQLLKVRDCMESKRWPGFSGDGDEVLSIDLPAYTYNSNGGAFTLTIGGADLPM